MKRNCYCGIVDGYTTHCRICDNNSFSPILMGGHFPPEEGGGPGERDTSSFGRMFAIDRSDVQMCPSMLASWIALYVVYHFALSPWS